MRWASCFTASWSARRTASHRFRILCTQQRWCRARGYTAGIAAANPGQPSVITNCNRLAPQSSAIQIIQQSFPPRLAFALGPHKRQQLTATIAAHSVGH